MSKKWWQFWIHDDTTATPAAPQPAAAPAPVAVPQAPAPGPAPVQAPAQTVVVSGVFIDRDDFMKAIGQSAIATYLDNKLVHNGVGGVNFYTQPDGKSISTTPPPVPVPVVPVPAVALPIASPAPPVGKVVDVGSLPGTFGDITDRPAFGNPNGIPVSSLSNAAPFPDQCYLRYIDETKFDPVKRRTYDIFFAVLSGTRLEISTAQNIGGDWVAGFDPVNYSSPMSDQLKAAVAAVTG